MSVSLYAQYPAAFASGSGGNTDVNLHDAAGNNINNGQQTMANSVPVAIASDQTAVPVSAGSLPLPTGAATAARQDTGNTSLASIDGKLGSLGQKAMAGSAPIVIASDQSAIPASQSGTWNINDITGTVSLPTGAATAAKQDTGNTSLASIDGKLGSLGQKAMAGSAPIVIASDQSAIPASQSGTWTVQPGNTANTTPWLATINQGGNSAAVTASNALKVDGSAVTQPVSLSAANAPKNTNGSIVNTSLSATTASSASAPANAVGFILEAPSTNTDNIRWCIGGTASTTVGMLAEPGRDTGYVPCAATISVCATASGTNAFSIQWVLSS